MQRQYRIKNRIIKEMREELRGEVEKDIQNLVEKNYQSDYRIKSSNPRLLFLSQYSLFSGLKLRSHDIQHTGDRENDIMKIFRCDPAWPVCLYDFAYKNKIPRYFCFRVKAQLTSLLISDYFNDERLDSKSQKPGAPLIQSNLSDVMIERNPHYCTHPKFRSSFQFLFETQSDLLLGGSEIFKFSIIDEVQIQRQLDLYEEVIVKSSIDDDQFEFDEKEEVKIDQPHILTDSLPLG